MPNEHDNVYIRSRYSSQLSLEALLLIADILRNINYSPENRLPLRCALLSQRGCIGRCILHALFRDSKTQLHLATLSNETSRGNSISNVIGASLVAWLFKFPALALGSTRSDSETLIFRNSHCTFGIVSSVCAFVHRHFQQCRSSFVFGNNKSIPVVCLFIYLFIHFLCMFICLHYARIHYSYRTYSSL